MLIGAQNVSRVTLSVGVGQTAARKDADWGAVACCRLLVRVSPLTNCSTSFISSSFCLFSLINYSKVPFIIYMTMNDDF